MGLPLTTFAENVTVATKAVNESGLDLFFLPRDYLDFATSEEFPLLDDNWLSFMSSKKLWVQIFSAQSVIFNLILILNLLLDDELRKWQFYPIIFQAVCDFLGPGVANLVYESRLEMTLEGTETVNFFMQGKIPFHMYDKVLHKQTSLFDCVLTYFRVFLNETSTGLCVCAVGICRYILVCHPTYNMDDKFSKKTAVIITLLVVLIMTSTTLDLAYNYLYAGDSNKRFHEKKVIENVEV